MNRNINFIITLWLCLSIAILAVSGKKFEIFEYLKRFNELPDFVDFVLRPIATSMKAINDSFTAQIDLSGNVISDILNTIVYAFEYIGNGFYFIIQILNIIPRIIIYFVKIILAVIPFIKIDAIGNFGGAWS